jgi:hypothetical protein
VGLAPSWCPSGTSFIAVHRVIPIHVATDLGGLTFQIAKRQRTATTLAGTECEFRPMSDMGQKQT